MKFKKLQKLFESGLDLLKPIDPSEVEDREKEGIVDKIKSTKHTVLSDGSYHIHENLNLIDNNLKSLLDLPIKISIVDGYFWCSFNKLTSLEGAPKEVRGDFDCSNNKLTNLEGGPKEVGGEFHCHNNKLTSLEGAPKEVGGMFFCNKNPGSNGNGFTEEDVKAVSNVKGKIYI